MLVLELNRLELELYRFELELYRLELYSVQVGGQTEVWSPFIWPVGGLNSQHQWSATRKKEMEVLGLHYVNVERSREKVFPSVTKNILVLKSFIFPH